MVGDGLGVHAPADARSRGCSRSHEAWLQRWPTPADLAAETTGEAVRAWGRLGYPRRALRLHAAATVIAEQHGNEVPASYDDLLRAARRRRLHRRRDRHLRLRPATRRARHQRAPGARPDRPGRGVPVGGGDQGRARGRPSRCCPRTSRPRRPGRSRSWSSARWCARRATRAAATAPSPTCAPGARPATRRTTGRRARCRPGPAPTGSAAAGCSPCSATATGRCTAPASTRPGPRRPSGSVAWPP